MKKILIAGLVCLIVGAGAAYFLAGVGSNDQSQSQDTFGSSGTRFPHGISADTTSPNDGEVRGTTITATASTTQQELILGSRFSGSLNFAAAATTTPGGLFAIQNTGSPKICNRVEVEISTAAPAGISGGTAGNGTSLTYNVGTSTAATNWSTGTGGQLIASTTNATGTTELLNSVQNTGTGTNVAGQSWLWGANEYILGAFDDASKSTGGGLRSTSSDPYTGQAGKYYVTCHTR